MTERTVNTQQTVEVGYGVVEAETGQALPAGSALFSYHNPQGVLTWQAGVGAVSPIHAGRILVDEQGKKTALAIVNQSGRSCQVDFTLRDQSGRISAQETRGFADGEHLALYVGELFPDRPEDFLGSLTFSGRSPGDRLAAITLRQSRNHRGEDILATLPVAELGAPPRPGPVIYPQVGAGEGLSTQLALINSSAEAVGGRIQLFDSAGNPLSLDLDGASGSEFEYRIEAEGVYLAELTLESGVGAGFAAVTLEEGETVPTGCAIFQYRSGTRVITEAGVAEAVPTTHARMLVETAESQIGLALANPSDTPVAVSLEVFNSNGHSQSKVERELPSKGHLALFIDELFPQLPLGFSGLLEITSTGPTAPVTLQLSTNSRLEPVLTTLPLADVDGPTGTGLAVFPQIGFGAGLSTRILLVSAVQTPLLQGVLRFHRPDGLPLLLLLDGAFDCRFEYQLRSQIGARFSPSAAEDPGRVTIAGTVRGPNGPVPNVQVSAWASADHRTTRTNGEGFYSLTLRVDGWISLRVEPALSTRLSHLNIWTSDIGPVITWNFILSRGHLLDIAFTGRSNEIFDRPIGHTILPMKALSAGTWYSLQWDETTGRHRAVLPPNIYSVTADAPPGGYFRTATSVDLRAGDRFLDIPLNETYVHPIPDRPPDASKIEVGPPNDLGEAFVAGSAGATLPLARVLLVNLNSAHQAAAVSNPDGSFNARIFAPPGSAVMIKHGPADWRWNALEAGLSEGVNPFPGCIVHVPYDAEPVDSGVPFAGAGACSYAIDDPDTTRNSVHSAWSMTGSFGPVLLDGEWVRVWDGRYNRSNVKGLYSGGMNWTHPALVDLDGDRDLDLVVGEHSGHLVLFRNQGTRTSPSFVFEDPAYLGISTGRWAYPALVDVTADGLPDLFLGTEDGSIQIRFNAGAATTPVFPEAPEVVLAAGNEASPTPVDIDGDGDLDLISGHSGGTLFLFRNTGTPSHPAWQKVTERYGGVSEPDRGPIQPAFVDLDGDSRTDLLIGLGGPVIWYRNSGSVANPAWTRKGEFDVQFFTSSAGSPATGDWSGDGKVDLVTGDHLGVLRFYRNDGGTAWTFLDLATPIDLLADAAPALHDWNGDGKLDLLAGQAHGEVHQFTNRGTPAEPDWKPEGVLVTLPWTNHPHAFPALADLNGDRAPELLIGEGGWDSPSAGGNLWYYQNDGLPFSPKWSLVTNRFLDLQVNGWAAPAFADIDGDKDWDLFVGDANGTLTFVENTGTTKAPRWGTPESGYGGIRVSGNSAPAFLDMDLDSDLDMIIGSRDGTLAYVRNIGGRLQPQWEFVTSEYPGIRATEQSRPTVGDLGCRCNATYDS